MNEHPKARLARLFNLRLAYDRRGLYRPQFLVPGTNPTIEGPWTVYGFGLKDEPTAGAAPE